MRQPVRALWISGGIVLSLGLPLCGSVVATLFLPGWELVHEPLHSLLEAAGGLMAIAIAGILINERVRQKDAEHFVWMASALIGMGVLDLFHSAVRPGNSFVWLHSTATCVGGALFSLVWLRGRGVSERFGRWLPHLVLVASVAFGGFSCLNESWIPRMTEGETEQGMQHGGQVEGFTALARGLNIGGGVGFLIAGAFFVRRFHRGTSNKDWLFSVHTVLFGAAGILFELSTLWDGPWWWWHILRLGAYLAALTFAVRTYLDAEGELVALNRQLAEVNAGLDRVVDKRTAELRTSEQRFALAVRGSADGLWDWDIHSDVVYYAARFKELLGYEDSEFENVFASFESHLHPADRDRILAAVRLHLEQRVPYDVQYRLRMKSGEYRWFRARGQAVWDEQGRPTRMAGSITDITEQKEAEASLQHERFLLRTLLEHLPDAIYFKDVEGHFTRVSRALANGVGAASPEELVGKSDMDFFPPQYAQEARNDELELMRTGQSLVGKEEHPRWARGTETWVSTTKIPLRNELGQVIGTFGISHDITAQKQAAARFRQVVDAAPNAILVVNRQGQIQLVNATTESVFGYSREELIGQPVEVLVPESVRNTHEQHRERYFRAPVPGMTGRELLACRRDGTEFPVEIGLSAIRLESELFVLASVHDITVRKQAEETLVTAKEAAEAANRAKSDFLANMSHEIRTPMHAIIGMTELVLDTELNPSQRDYLTIVLESAESLLSIINEVLDFARIEAGKLELDCVEFDVREEMGDTLKALGLRAHDKGLELAWQVEPDVPPYLAGDPARLRQILINLVGNAIKFTDQGEVFANVRVDARRDGRVVLHFIVRDTGRGIPENKRSTIFSAFEQADTSTTREFGGTGLGLAITARIVEAMGGRIWAESVCGKGSTFHVTAEFRTAAMPHKTATESFDVVNLPIVIVDDNATNRRILTEMLQRWGMNVRTTESASQALEALQELQREGGAPPLLLSDVNMPDFDGFMLVERLRAMESLRNTAVILLTSGGRPGDAARCKQLGVAAHLMKPVKQSELLEAILQAVGHPARPRTAAAESPHPEPVDRPPLRILLAEDGKANQAMALALLSKWGHRVTIAENGKQAVARWKAEPFDLILMDVQMPVMDGLEATRCIREAEQPTGNRIPILAMTARAMKGDRERCLSAGMDGYLSKPIRRRELQDAIAEFYPTPPSRVTESCGTAGSDSTLVDWNLALQNLEGDTELLNTVIEASLSETAKLLNQLETALEAGQAEVIKRAAHTVKASGRLFGVQPLLESAGSVEQLARDHDLAGVRNELPKLREVSQQMIRELQRRLGKA